MIFLKKIKYIRSNGIKHNNIILDPGIGFGKNLKHNITLLRNISIFHSLGFPVMLGTSRKRFIKDLSGANDKERLGGTISSSLFAIMQGVQILRVHDVNELKAEYQGVQFFKILKMLKKYFGTDGIRGRVNQKKINGEMFFKFGLAAGTYFKNQKKIKQTAVIAKRYQIIRIFVGASFSFWISIGWYACLYTWTFAHQWSCNVNKKNES